jgi:hypothetical protein
MEISNWYGKAEEHYQSPRPNIKNIKRIINE